MSQATQRRVVRACDAAWPWVLAVLAWAALVTDLAYTFHVRGLKFFGYTEPVTAGLQTAAMLEAGAVLILQSIFLAVGALVIGGLKGLRRTLRAAVFVGLGVCAVVGFLEFTSLSDSVRIFFAVVCLAIYIIGLTLVQAWD